MTQIISNHAEKVKQIDCLLLTFWGAQFDSVSINVYIPA